MDEQRIDQSLRLISDDGVPPGGIRVIDVIRFIQDHRYEAKYREVAGHFGLEATEVAAAISFHARRFARPRTHQGPPPPRAVIRGGMMASSLNRRSMQERIGQSFGQISRDGVFPNGVKVVNVIRFIRDYDYEADLDHIASYFRIEPEDVAAAISFHARNFEWLHPKVLEAER